MSNFELESYSCAFSKKLIFSIVKDLFKYFEGLCRSAIVLVSSTEGLISDLGGLRKKYLIRCQIWSSKVILVRFHKVIFSMVKDLFKLFEGLRRSGTVLVSSAGGLIVHLAGI